MELFHAGSLASVGCRNGCPDQVEERSRRRRRPPRRWPGWTRSTPKSTPWSTIGRRTCWRRPQPSMRRSGAARTPARWRRAGHGQGQYRSGRLCHHQRPQAAARRHREDQQPGDRQSAQGRRRHSRAHQLPGVFLSLVHHQSRAWRHQKSARSRHHPGRLVRRGGCGGGGGHRPYRARHRYRGIDPLSRLCLRRARPAADGRAHRGLQRFAAGTADRAADLARYRVRWRAPSAISGSRWRRCRASMRAIPGGCRRRWKGRRSRSAPRCASIPTGSIPCRSEGRGRRCRQAAGARRLDRRGDRHHAAAARGHRMADQTLARRQL